jgi:hypothetical protein
MTQQIGDKMPDGTIFAGISPDTKKPMYATPADAPLAMRFNEACEYARNLVAYGHKDWHVPTRAELNVLFNNRAKIGGFTTTHSKPSPLGRGGEKHPGWYWTNSPGRDWSHAQRFSDGWKEEIDELHLLSSRPVR